MEEKFILNDKSEIELIKGYRFLEDFRKGLVEASLDFQIVEQVRSDKIVMACYSSDGSNKTK